MDSCTLGNVRGACFLPFKLLRAEATGPPGHRGEPASLPGPPLHPPGNRGRIAQLPPRPPSKLQWWLRRAPETTGREAGGGHRTREWQPMTRWMWPLLSQRRLSVTVVGCLSLFLAWPSSGNLPPSRSPSDNGLSSVIEAEHANSWLSRFSWKDKNTADSKFPSPWWTRTGLQGTWAFWGHYDQ